MYTGLSPQITKWIWVNSALSVILLLAAVAVVVVSLYFFEGKTPEEVVSFMRDHGFRKNESLLPYTERTYGVIFALLFMIGLFAVGALVGTLLGTTGGLAHLEGPKGEHWKFLLLVSPAWSFVVLALSVEFALARLEIAFRRYFRTEAGVSLWKRKGRLGNRP